MTVVLSGSDLTVEEVIRVARGKEPVEIEPGAFDRMSESRALVERVVARGDVVYGMTTGVGARKKTPVPVDEIPAFNRALIANHRTATGPDAPVDTVRATMLRLANTLARGTSGARPEIAERLLLEYDDERSGGFEPLAEVPEDKIAVLGLVTTKSSRRETVDELAGRIREAARFLPLERLALSPQCGFATSILGNALTLDDEKAKLQTIAQTAEAVWG